MEYVSHDQSRKEIDLLSELVEAIWLVLSDQLIFRFDRFASEEFVWLLFLNVLYPHGGGSMSKLTPAVFFCYCFKPLTSWIDGEFYAVGILQVIEEIDCSTANQQSDSKSWAWRAWILQKNATNAKADLFVSDGSNMTCCCVVQEWNLSGLQQVQGDGWERERKSFRSTDRDWSIYV